MKPLKPLIKSVYVNCFLTRNSPWKKVIPVRNIRPISQCLFPADRHVHTLICYHIDKFTRHQVDTLTGRHSNIFTCQQIDTLAGHQIECSHANMSKISQVVTSTYSHANRLANWTSQVHTPTGRCPYRSLHRHVIRQQVYPPTGRHRDMFILKQVGTLTRRHSDRSTDRHTRH